MIVSRKLLRQVIPHDFKAPSLNEEVVNSLEIARPPALPMAMLLVSKYFIHVG